MHKPAARIGDDHICPKATPGTPPILHVGGPVVGPGCLTVLIEGMPAARVGDNCFCVGEPDKIATGSSGVFIGGMPAARMSDMTTHGGKIIAGCGTVLIGEVMGIDLLNVPEPVDIAPEFIEPLDEAKKVILNQALKDCVILLVKKGYLLKINDNNTLLEFKKWFGNDSDESKQIILKRIHKVLKICKKLTVENFDKILDDKDRRDDFAQVYNKDKSYKFFLGDHFWEIEAHGHRFKAGVLIHELSHFKKIGNTLDHAYGFKGCLMLAEVDPQAAIFNADSFEFFITYKQDSHGKNN